MKRISFIVLSICLALLMVIPAYADAEDVPSVDNQDKVYDFADLLTESEEKALRSDLLAFIDKNNLDIAVVTTYENSQSAMEYADDFYDYNNFGVGTSKDGLLFLIDMANRKLWITTTGKAILIYTDEDIDAILDDIYNALGEDTTEYYEAAKAFVESSQRVFDVYARENSPSHRIIEFMVGLLFNPFAMIIVAIILIILIKKDKKNASKLDVMAENYYSPSDVKILVKKNNYIRTVTRHRRIDTSSGGGGGHGSSSSHTSSSGSSHGGGGRSF